MDVTSLLNANSLAAEQQKKAETSKAPSRSRTPWDAGGYALPINTVSSGTSTPPRPAPQNESPMGTPTSPRHKFSDSRSSLSSFTSSSNSANHSRFSSMSTVNSIHPLNSLAEALSPKIGSKTDILDFAALSTSAENARPPPINSFPRDSLSPTLSLDALALVAENRLVGRHNSANQQAPDDTTTTNINNEQQGRNVPRLHRPSSPSDAILIKRTTVPTLRVDTGDNILGAVNLATPNRNYLSAPLENHHQDLLHKSHKRALSAPDFGAVGTFDMSTTTSPRAVPAPEPTPPTSQHPDNPSPTNFMSYAAPDTPPATATDVDNQAIVCMYIPNCDTGSQARKAISHIFGRNKMCTRLIPQHIWVHYCRKHYQRSRYRNPKEYAKLQCDLVQQQIRRVHEWSENNKKIGAPGVVQDWGLAVRKREQKRLDEMKGSKRKRGSSNVAFYDQGSDGDDGDDSLDRGKYPPATAVPGWLLDLCRKGYSTQEILEIFNRLHTDMLKDTMSCFPDIEILPNIVVDEDEPKSPKGYAKRPAASSHKRAQSLGVGMKPDYIPVPDRRLSQPSIWVGHESSSYGSPIDKRRRIVHRQNIPDISEHQADQAYFSFSPQSQYQQPLPAPTPQRMTGQSMAAHLETHNEHLQGARRPVHQRSQSDMSAFTRGRNDHPSGSSYFIDHQNSRPSPFHEQSPSTGYGYPNQFRMGELAYQSGQYNNMRVATQLPGLGHVRNHSTPMAQSSYPAATMQGMRPSQYSQQPHMGSSHNPNVYTRVIESQAARDIYAARR